jgi:molecular chaperone HscB
MPPSLNCWHCGQPVSSLFCPACGSLQSPPAGFFSFFGLPEQLSIDIADLQKRFYELSRQLHPDRYTRKSERERQYSLEATAILNDGYRALRDPVKRAEYVLKQNGLDVGEQRSKNVPAELLEEVFELNMALEELREGDSSVRPQLEKAEEHFRGMLTDVDGELEHQFRTFDQAEDGRTDILAKIRATLNRRRYIQNLVGEVEKELCGAGFSLRGASAPHEAA